MASSVATNRIPGFLYFHMANAYYFKDANGKVTVHVDICSYSTKHVPVFEYSMSNILDPLAAFSNGPLVRYELEDVHGSPDPTEIRCGTVRQSIACDLKLPRIRKNRFSVPRYRYVCGASDLGGHSPGTQIPVGRLGNDVGVTSRAFLGHLVKTDLKTGEVIHWYPTDSDSCPCEPIFVERPVSTEEDDGVVLTIVCNWDGTKSVLVVLDGQTMKEIARADMPQVYGIGFHSTFIEPGR
jgi:torulene dioxygenase